MHERSLIFLFFSHFLMGLAICANAELASPDFLAKTPEWRALLHYFDQSTSEVSGGPFFLSKNGAEDPRAELEATLKAFQEKNPAPTLGVLKQTAYCAFPARRNFLERHGYRFPHQPCPDLDRFVESINAQSLTYVFSSAYPNNPASLFGHTFIRINQGRNDPLRDYGVNFSAKVPAGEMGIVYIPRGLLGLYGGGYEISPYFNKVLEYNEAESRDIWEYDLDFSSEESKRFVLHLWEVRWLAEFHYAFLKKNCSYQMIRMLQATRPELKFPTGLQLYVLPGETVRWIKHAIKNTRYRASHFKILQHRYQTLNDEQKKTFHTTIKNESSITQQKDPMILETLTSYYDYLKIQQQESVQENTATALRETRVARARLGGESRFPEIQAPVQKTNRPDWSHSSKQIQVFQATHSKSRARTGARLRLGLHDLLNRDDGYEATFGVTGMAIAGSYSYFRKKFEFEQLDLISIHSIQPMVATHHPFSWKLSLGWEQLNDHQEDLNSAFAFKAGAGPAFEAIEDHLWMGAFLGFATQIDEAVLPRDWAQLEFEPYLLFRASSRTKAWLGFTMKESTYFARYTHQLKFDFAQALSDRHELRLSAQSGFEAKAGIAWFF